MSSLKPEVSLGVALATGAVVYGIYQRAIPSVADVRSLDSQNKDIDSAERQATWTAAAVVGGISLMAKDPTIFTVGGIMVIAEAWKTRHANLVDSVTGKAVPGLSLSDTQAPITQAENPDAYSAPSSPTYDMASVF
jgi:hypothetical protein